MIQKYVLVFLGEKQVPRTIRHSNSDTAVVLGFSLTEKYVWREIFLLIFDVAIEIDVEQTIVNDRITEWIRGLKHFECGGALVFLKRV